jgi:hypothetical protein
MEFCEGGKVDDLNYMKDHGIAVEEVYRLFIVFCLSVCVLSCCCYVFLHQNHAFQ